MNIRALIAEALGTYILVAVGSMSILSASGGQSPAILVVPFGFGLALMAGIAIFGPVSGAHFNPAVTLAAWIDRRLSVVSAIGYVVAQLVGALAASFTVLIFFAKDVVGLTRTNPITAVTDQNAFAIEVILSTIFIAVILTMSRRFPTHAIFIVPLTLVMVHFAGVGLSGASVNPVRSLAPAIVVGDYTHLWVYLTAPFVGAVLAWGIYWLMTPPEAETVVEMELGPDEADEGDESEGEDTTEAGDNADIAGERARTEELPGDATSRRGDEEEVPLT